MAKFINYKTANTFKEAIKDRVPTEIFFLTKTGVSAKRCFFRGELRYDNRYLRLEIVNKFDRWIRTIDVSMERVGNKLNSNVLYRYDADIITTSRDFAYQHCMSVIKDKIRLLRGKEMVLHEEIYAL